VHERFPRHHLRDLTQMLPPHERFPRHHLRDLTQHVDTARTFSKLSILIFFWIRVKLFFDYVLTFITGDV
jgi:hypothetical protein